MAHIGNKIERIRSARQIKQQTMAESLGITQQRWSQLIKEEVWSSKNLQKVSEIYSMTPEEIQQYDDEKSIVSKGDNNIISGFIVNLNITALDAGMVDNLIDLLSKLRDV